MRLRSEGAMPYGGSLGRDRDGPGTRGGDRDSIALRTALEIEELFDRTAWAGGPLQRRAAVQVAVAAAIDKFCGRNGE